MKKIIVLLFVVFCFTNIMAQKKDYRQAKDYLKAGNNLTKAEQLVNQCIASEKGKTNLKYYQMAGDIQKKVHAIENEKLYLRRNYDTVLFFNSLRKTFLCYERCDSLERDSTENPRQKFKYRKGNRETLLPLRRNLAAGGRFYLQKNKYADAYTYLSTYVETASQPMFAADNFILTDRHLPRVAYLAVYAAHMQKDKEDNVLKYKDIALLDSTMRPRVMEYMADAYRQKNDTTNWIATLENGIFSYPSQTYFFVNLMDYFNEKSRYEDGLEYANEMLTKDSTNTLYMYAKVLALMNLKRYGECVAMCNNILDVDSAYVEAYYNIAVAHCNEAVELERNACINVKLPQFKMDHDRIAMCYQKARPYMEKVRAMQPDNTQKWAPMLYRIYLNLNMGKEFGEIDRLLNQSNQPTQQ